MAGTEPGSVRDEAERLVANLLATAQLAAAGRGPAAWGPLGEMVSGVFGHTGPGQRGGARTAGGPAGPDADRADRSDVADSTAATSATGSGGFATGSPECCVCPVCRGIAALRDPSPEFAERLATGAGDLAAGVASVLRAFASATTEPTGPAPAGDGPDTAGQRADHAPEPDGAGRHRPAGAAGGAEVWREATRTGHDSQPAPEPDVWSAATRAEAVSAPAAPVPPVDAAGPAPVPRGPADRTEVSTSRPSGPVVEETPGDGV